jgi:hypothetical protein
MRASRTACGRNLGLAVAACLCLPTTVRADGLPVAPPLLGGEAASAQDEQRSAPLPLRLEEDEASPVHRIVIPAAVLAKLAGMPLRSTSDTAAATIRSVVAGIALSVAVGCGLVAFRRGRPIRIAAVVLIGLALAGGGGVCRLAPAHADMLPDALFSGRTRPRNPRAEVIDVATLRQGGKVIVELSQDKDGEVVFVVGKQAEPKKQ